MRLSQARTRVIAQSFPSVVFLQGAYGFKDIESGLMLRHVMGPHNRPLVAPTGQPLLTIEGDGPVAERQFVGTGFAVENHGVLITNRHVAVPWENDATAGLYSEQGYEAVMIKFIGYPPGESEPSAVEFFLASEEADLAILRWGGEVRIESGLRLADTLPAAGDSVIVMGYPTGLRSMLVQAGPTFVEKLQEMNDTNFWSVAERLGKEGHIAPLSSRGIVGQITEATIVYDADTTLGGSGGPVLNADGEVGAVNAAILPDYGGSNLGVPVVFLRALLEDAGLR